MPSWASPLHQTGSPCFISAKGAGSGTQSVSAMETSPSTETLDEDPVSFLARMREGCPEILSILNSKQAELLSKCPTDTYCPETINEDYLADMSAYYGIKNKCKDAKTSLSRLLLEPRARTKSLDVERAEKTIEILNKVGVTT